MVQSDCLAVNSRPKERVTFSKSPFAKDLARLLQTLADQAELAILRFGVERPTSAQTAISTCLSSSEPDRIPGLIRPCAGMELELTRLLGRKVDLVALREDRASRYYIRRRAVLEEAEVQYVREVMKSVCCTCATRPTTPFQLRRVELTRGPRQRADSTRAGATSQCRPDRRRSRQPGSARRPARQRRPFPWRPHHQYAPPARPRLLPHSISMSSGGPWCGKNCQI